MLHHFHKIDVITIDTPFDVYIPTQPTNGTNKPISERRPMIKILTNQYGQPGIWQLIRWTRHTNQIIQWFFSGTFENFYRLPSFYLLYNVSRSFVRTSLNIIYLPTFIGRKWPFSPHNHTRHNLFVACSTNRTKIVEIVLSPTDDSMLCFSLGHICDCFSVFYLARTDPSWRFGRCGPSYTDLHSSPGLSSLSRQFLIPDSLGLLRAGERQVVTKKRVSLRACRLLEPTILRSSHVYVKLIRQNDDSTKIRSCCQSYSKFAKKWYVPINWSFANN